MESMPFLASRYRSVLPMRNENTPWEMGRKKTARERKREREREREREQSESERVRTLVSFFFRHCFLLFRQKLTVMPEEIESKNEPMLAKLGPLRR